MNERRLEITSPARWGKRGLALAGLLVAGAVALPHARAASSNGCEGGGFTVSFSGGAPASSGAFNANVPAGSVGPTITVRGRYVEFDINAATFGVTNWTLTGAPNALDITGGARTSVFASKLPDHRNLVLNGNVALELDAEDMVITRTGAGLAMKVQAKDCAQGGIFQMEVERDDNTETQFTHTLGAGAVYFDNQNFRDREGEVLPYKNITATVTNRINFGNPLSSRFVGRDSPQVARRINHPTCTNVFPNRTSIGGNDTVQHCGGVSVWMVTSGGRMGQVMGEDSTEVAPPATNCTQNCQAQNRVRGRAVVLGFPFPLRNVLVPRTP